MNFGDKVRNRLVEVGRNQTQLAKAIGTSQQQVSEWLNQNRPPKWSFLLPMAQFLRVTCDYLLDPEMEEPQDVGLPQDERMLLTLYRSLKERDKLDVNGALAALTDEVGRASRARVDKTYAPEVNQPGRAPPRPSPKIKKNDRLG